MFYLFGKVKRKAFQRFPSALAVIFRIQHYADIIRAFLIDHKIAESFLREIFLTMGLIVKIKAEMKDKHLFVELYRPRPAGMPIAKTPIMTGIT